MDIFFEGGIIQSPQYPSLMHAGPSSPMLPWRRQLSWSVFLSLSPVPSHPLHIFSDFSQVSAVWIHVVLTLSSTQDTHSTPYQAASYCIK